MPETEYLHNVFGDIQQYHYLFNTTETCTDGVTIVQKELYACLGYSIPIHSVNKSGKKKKYV